MSVIWPDKARAFALAESIIVRFEGFRAKPYLCPAGVPTIGYGTTKYPDGRKVQLADSYCSEFEARHYLQFAMDRVWMDLQRSGAVQRSPNVKQAAAFLSLTYNIGVGAHDGVKGDFADSSLIECFNRGDLEGAKRHFLDWNKTHVNNVVVSLPGLTSRRMAEQTLFSQI